MPICPAGKVAGKHLFQFSGSTDFSFTAKMQQASDIQLDDREEVKLSANDTYPAVFQFIPAEDISSTQLDITVTSESDDVLAYLKVSRDCKDVKDNIDAVDYKGKSLRLSFAKKGRITLSKFSTPPLDNSNSSWFIGIGIKNASGDTPIDARKTVILTLKRSFDYSYSPLMSLGTICLVLGVVLSFWAWRSFRRRTNLTSTEISQAMRVVLCTYTFSQGTKTFSYITFIVGSVLMVGSFQFVFADWYLMIHEGDRDHCYYNDLCYRVRYADIPFNLIVSNLAYVVHGLILAVNVLLMESQVLAHCKKLASSAKQKREEKLRLVYNKMEKRLNQVITEKVNGAITAPNPNETGYSKELDYILKVVPDDELPGHLLTCPDISLHLEEMLVPKVNTADLDLEGALKKKYSFSLGYALAWALCFQGMFSALYHFCPSRFTFQFDTAFMFVIAGLSVIFCYNGIERQPCTTKVEAKRRVGAANLFLFFFVPLLIFNYFGTMYHSEAGLNEKLQIFLFPLFIIWVFIIALWARYKLSEVCRKHYCIRCKSNYESCKCQTCCCTKKFVVTIFCAIAVFTPLVLIVLWFLKIVEFTNAILGFCIAESLIVLVGSFWLSPKPWARLRASCSKNVYYLIFQVGSMMLYLCTTLALNISALWIFFAKETTNKGKPPEKSRDLNQECILLAYFDWHDMWHISSSFGLIMWTLMAIHISYACPELDKRQSQTSVPVEM